MKKYYSYEQVVSAAIACYKKSLTTDEIVELIKEVKEAFPNVVLANDVVRATKYFIIDLEGEASLNPNFQLDSNVFVRGHTITVKEYLCRFAGARLVSFMENKKQMLDEEVPQM